MPKRGGISRPWDRKHLKQAAHARFQERRQQQEQATAIPFVEVEGKKFYSDRFYLNSTIFDDNSEGSDSGSATECCCGASNPPPLLDRSALVASLDLKYAVLATYTLRRDTLARQFPSLFGPDATVPTLVLHGRKKKDTDEEKTNDRRHRHRADDSDCESLEDAHYNDHLNESAKKNIDENVGEESSWDEENDDDDDDDDDDCSLATQTQSVRDYAAQFCSPSPKRKSGGNKKRKSENIKSPIVSPKPLPLPGQQPKHVVPSFPAHVHFTEVTPTWLSLRDLPTTVVKPDGSIVDKIVQKRKYKQGVHHPKFMLLFEKSGSLVIMVSTANLTRQRTTDGTWVQRFQPISSTGTHSANTDCPGRILGHFLDCETWACQPSCMTPLGFGRCHLGWKTQSCQELALQYDFSKSQVYLVPHVPGDYDISIDAAEATTTKHSFCYGRQFVSRLLRNKLCRAETSSKESQRPWLPQCLLSEQDRLVVQPTSFGGHWTIPSMAKMVSSFLENGQDIDANDHHESQKSFDSLLSKMDIVWPTDEWIRAIHSRGSLSPTSVAQIGFVQTGDKRDKSDVEEARKRHNNGFLFMSSVSFNSVHLDCLSRMAMFEPSTPSQQPKSNNGALVPHFKSIARLYGGSRYPLQKEFGVGKSNEYLSWFMLTSACLSRGAQGFEATHTTKPHEKGDIKKPTCQYTNFELGVLFCSRLQNSAADRLYCWKPSACSCRQGKSSTTKATKLIHLPIPFELRPSYYLQDPAEDSDFCETPYFHEIPRGTGNTGNMRFIPHGIAIGEQENGILS